MQKQQVQEQINLSPAKLNGPVEIDMSLLAHVSGGAPKNTWSEPQALEYVEAPKNTW